MFLFKYMHANKKVVLLDDAKMEEEKRGSKTKTYEGKNDHKSVVKS